MKKASLILIFIFSFFMVNCDIIYASSGRLRKDSIVSCNGIIYGQHSSDNHWHIATKNGDGTYNASGSPIYSNPCGNQNNNADYSNQNNFNSNGTYRKENQSQNSISTPKSTPTPIPKSSDNTIKSILVDGKIIGVQDTMTFSTKKEEVDIDVTPNDSNATYKILNQQLLKLGKNEFIVEVTAENGATKQYKLMITREKILSSNVGIKIFINNEEVVFENFSQTIYLFSNEKNVKIDYILDDKNATVKMNKIKELKTGDNQLKIVVTAEDSTKQEYHIIIHKNSLLEDIITIVILIGIVGGLGYGFYYLVKHRKKSIHIKS